MEGENNTLKQRKIALAQSEHAGTIIDLIRDVIPRRPLVGGTEWETIVSAVTMDTLSTLMLDLTKYIDDIRKGILHDEPTQ